MHFDCSLSPGTIENTSASRTLKYFPRTPSKFPSVTPPYSPRQTRTRAVAVHVGKQNYVYGAPWLPLELLISTPANPRRHVSPERMRRHCINVCFGMLHVSGVNLDVEPVTSIDRIYNRWERRIVGSHCVASQKKGCGGGEASIINTCLPGFMMAELPLPTGLPMWHCHAHAPDMWRPRWRFGALRGYNRNFISCTAKSWQR